MVRINSKSINRKWLKLWFIFIRSCYTTIKIFQQLFSRKTKINPPWVKRVCITICVKQEIEIYVCVFFRMYYSGKIHRTGDFYVEGKEIWTRRGMRLEEKSISFFIVYILNLYSYSFLLSHVNGLSTLKYLKSNYIACNTQGERNLTSISWDKTQWAQSACWLQDDFLMAWAFSEGLLVETE